MISEFQGPPTPTGQRQSGFNEIRPVLTFHGYNSVRLAKLLTRD